MPTSFCVTSGRSTCWEPKPVERNAPDSTGHQLHLSLCVFLCFWKLLFPGLFKSKPEGTRNVFVIFFRGSYHYPSTDTPKTHVSWAGTRIPGFDVGVRTSLFQAFQSLLANAVLIHGREAQSLTPPPKLVELLLRFLHTQRKGIPSK